jgi:GNAT superfamily N-acetyltransferase
LKQYKRPELQRLNKKHKEVSMAVEVLPLEEKHLEEAAFLAARRYRAEKKRVELLPADYEKPETILALMAGFSKNGHGVCVIDKGRMRGFLKSRLYPMDKGFTFGYIPEYCHAVKENNWNIYRVLYASLSQIWAENRCASQAVTIMAHDQNALDAWLSMGFGMTGIDALRDFSPVQGETVGVTIRRAGLSDVDILFAQDLAINQHLVAAPIFRPFMKESRESREQWLANPSNALWLAELESETVAGIGLEPSSPDAAAIIRAEKTISITSAFTQEKWRGQGIATALLDHSLKWAKSSGYQRCAVDFESANISGSGFWLGQGFEPVCYTLRRQVPRQLLAG